MVIPVDNGFAEAGVLFGSISALLAATKNPVTIASDIIMLSPAVKTVRLFMAFLLKISPT